ncbi:adenine phosphoribosyltransferase 5 [Senna tora]|uniref:adenine phosphoribosyltransferase n=1 Tax=Senna tora TaxID=362788 RepID=A0A834TXA7_9FABA|nr:adenine phosphoribosyltransferase 5 [Senna tora]
MFAEENGLKGDPRLQAISEAIRVVPHFPKQGIMFQDITTLLLDHKAFKDTVDIFVDRYRDMDISVVAGVEARGFMFGPSIALGIGAKFIPLRKPRKLPGEVISEKYVLEYGTDCLEMHVGAVQPGERALVIDDLVATGGTLSAAIRLLERVGAEVVECACVIGVPEVKIIRVETIFLLYIYIYIYFKTRVSGTLQASWKATVCPCGAASNR